MSDSAVSPFGPDTTTPVQTPLAEHYEKIEAKNVKSDTEPQKPLSPPRPSPSPEKHKLDDAEENSAKKPKTEEEELEEEPVANNGEAGSQPTEAMVPAPKPPAEPDMDNLPENPMPKHQAKFALNTIKAIKRLRDAGPFLHPVDIVKLNVPLYYNYITRPMDLATIERKISADAYEDPQQVVADFDLMVRNCRKFNGETSGISRMAMNIQAQFEKHMLNIPPKVLASNGASSPVNNANSRRRTVPEDLKKESVAAHRPKRTIHPPKSKELPYDVRPRKKKFAQELRYCSQVIRELTSKKHFAVNFPFLQPVDPVALGIPNYSEVVKEPMDLGTVQTKLANNQYENGDEFERDVRLIFHNCYLFNPEGNDVHAMGKKLELIFDKKWAQKPVHVPTPVHSDYDSSDLDDEDEPEINEAMLLSVPAIQFLENQLDRMKKELDELKKQHLEKLQQQREARHKKKKGLKKKRGGKSAEQPQENVPVVTYEMKKQVSEIVPTLNDKKLQALIKIIKDDIVISDEEEVELDMDQLEDRTVLKLYNFLFGKKAASSAMKKQKKSTYSSGNIDQLEQLRLQLQLFDDVERGGSSGHFDLNSIPAQESSEDDLSSESSEEE